MSNPGSPSSLNDLLRAVSRSFYLTLRVVPRSMRRQLSIAYLFCRAADTIADTRLLPPAERLAHLETFREPFVLPPAPDPAAFRALADRLGAPLEIPEERELLERLPECFDVYGAFSSHDRGLIQRLVSTLTLGMRFDLETFPAEDSGEVRALESDGDLDRYCYHVAGCVGEYWTDLQCSHLRALRSWDVVKFRESGVRFGKALQMTNILRDVERDWGIGRCYLPRSRLEAAGWSGDSLPGSEERRSLRPIIHDLLRVTLDHYESAWEYTLAIPRRVPQLRLACVWPLWIGLRTLQLIAESDDPCSSAASLKIARSEVYRHMRRSVLRVFSSKALDREFRRLFRNVEDAL